MSILGIYLAIVYQLKSFYLFDTLATIDEANEVGSIYFNSLLLLSIYINYDDHDGNIA